MQTRYDGTLCKLLPEVTVPQNRSWHKRKMKRCPRCDDCIDDDGRRCHECETDPESSSENGEQLAKRDADGSSKTLSIAFLLGGILLLLPLLPYVAKILIPGSGGSAQMLTAILILPLASLACAAILIGLMGLCAERKDSDS